MFPRDRRSGVLSFLWFFVQWLLFQRCVGFTFDVFSFFLSVTLVLVLLTYDPLQLVHNLTVLLVTLPSFVVRWIRSWHYVWNTSLSSKFTYGSIIVFWFSFFHWCSITFERRFCCSARVNLPFLQLRLFRLSVCVLAFSSLVSVRVLVCIRHVY